MVGRMSAGGCGLCPAALLGQPGDRRCTGFSAWAIIGEHIGRVRSVRPSGALSPGGTGLVPAPPSGSGVAAHDAKDSASINLEKNGKTFLVLCKHCARNRADGGFAVTVGSFTRDAQACAARAKLTLIDGPALRAIIEQTRASRLHCPNCGKPMLRRNTDLDSGSDTAFWVCAGAPVCQGTRPVLAPLI